ncbi:MAG: zinc-ribbon domain-containing protein [Clostridiales bacterium]|nr:zinc-ribbon domain-containing protein [Clostridiales bacterium]
MAFCGNCGAKAEEGVKFCPNCGTLMEAPAVQPEPLQAAEAVPESAAAEEPKAYEAAAEKLGDAADDFAAKMAALNDTADSTAAFDAADIQQNKVMAVLAYLSWLVIIPLFAARQSKFARYHANQGLVLAIAEILWWIVTGILSTVLYAISWRLGIISTILGLVNLVFLAAAIIGIINAANGRAKDLPVIGKIRILK